MSEETPRRRKRAADHPEDWYPTPPAVVRELQAQLPGLPGGRWLEPAAGDGALVRVFAHRHDVAWDLVEIRREARDSLWSIPGQIRIECPQNYLLRAAPHRPYAVAITNPPFNRAARFVAKMVEEAEVAICLLRLAFLESEKRNAFLCRNPPDVYVLPKRPSFTDGLKTDRSAYAWMVWRRGAEGGHLRVLPLAGPSQQLALGGTHG